MLRRRGIRIWAAVILLVAVTLFLAGYTLKVVIGFPKEGVWGTVPGWGSLGDVWQGLGVLVLALGALVGAGWALYQYLEQRERELGLRARQNDLDMARLQGDLMAELRLRYANTKEQPEGLAVEDELRRAEDRYLAILRGLVLLRPELARAEREAITAYLDDMAEL